MTLENNHIKSLATPAATGGTITTSSGYRIHTFTSSGTFIANKTMNVEALVIAGGGGCGQGGGGAGGVLYNDSLAISQSTYTVTVGNGGGTCNSDATCASAVTNGQNSVFSILTAIGGGGSGFGSQYGHTGGSGGGGGCHNGVSAGGAGTAGQGYAGGNNQQANPYNSGGGGGAGEAGETGSVSRCGNGGDGISTYSDLLIAANAGVDILGTRWIAGGGAGGVVGRTYGTAGKGGGATNGDSGTANTGGGGGGNYSGMGGSGIVIIRYPLSEDILGPANITATDMIVTKDENPCRTGICTITVDVTWTNSGESTGSFTPAITVSSGTVTPTYSSEQLAASTPVTHTFTVSNMIAGQCSICPNPN